MAKLSGKRRKRGKPIISEEVRKRLEKREGIITGKDLLPPELETPPPEPETMETDAPNEDELEELDFGPFDLEACFPPVTEIVVDLDTLKVETVSVAKGVVVGAMARSLLQAVEEIAQALRQRIQNYRRYGDVEDLFEQRFLTKPEQVGREYWGYLKKNLSLALYRNGALVKVVFLEDIVPGKPGRPKKKEREAFLRSVLEAYPPGEFRSLGALARAIWEEKPETRSLWPTLGAFRKALSRFLRS